MKKKTEPRAALGSFDPSSDSILIAVSSSLPVLLLASNWVDDAERLVAEEVTFVFELLGNADNFLGMLGRAK